MTLIIIIRYMRCKDSVTDRHQELFSVYNTGDVSITRPSMGDGDRQPMCELVAFNQ